jgi:hypothetical protein
MSPLVSPLCLLLGSFILLTQGLIFSVAWVIAHPGKRDFDDRH